MDYAIPLTPRILIVDDEKDLVEILAFSLGKRGYDSIRAFGGKEAWDRMASERFDLVVLDLMMPDLDGWELCRMVRRNERKEIRETPILMLSARALPEDRIQGLEIGADDYMAKPFSLSELTLRVEKLLAKRQTLQALSAELDSVRSQIREQGENLRELIHDLKTPLISIGASAKLLMRPKNAASKTDFLKNIYDNSLRLNRWLEEILVFSEIARGKIGGHVEEVDLGALIKDSVEMLRATAENAEIEISFGAAVDLVPIRCHRGWMQRACENLLSNALKYGRPGGRVEVIVSQCHVHGRSGLEAKFQDDDIGILPEELHRIFEPFHRGRNALDRPGIGLGLPLVKRVLECHDGEVEVQSEIGRGSTFSIRLPAAE